jgi:hypothetical protein
LRRGEQLGDLRVELAAKIVMRDPVRALTRRLFPTDPVAQRPLVDPTITSVLSDRGRSP